MTKSLWAIKRCNLTCMAEMPPLHPAGPRAGLLACPTPALLQHLGTLSTSDQAVTAPGKEFSWEVIRLAEESVLEQP